MGTHNYTNGDDDIDVWSPWAIIDAYGGDDDIDVHGVHITVWAGTGNDTIDVWAIAGTVWAGSGQDEIWIHAADATVRAQAGDDYIDVTAGNATVYADEGNDNIQLKAANAWAFGGDGNDWFAIVAANAYAIGGTGNDGFSISAGGAVVVDDEGDDWVNIKAASAEVTTGRGNDTIMVGALAFHADVHSGSGNDTITVNALDATVDAGAGHDTLVVRAGGSKMSVGSGNDTIKGGAVAAWVDDTTGNLKLQQIAAFVGVTKTGSGNVTFDGGGGYIKLNHSGAFGDIRSTVGSVATEIYREGQQGNLTFSGGGAANVIATDLDSGNLTFSGGAAANIITHRAWSGNLTVTSGGGGNVVKGREGVDSDVRLYGGANVLTTTSSGFTKGILAGGANIVRVSGHGGSASGGSDIAAYGIANVITTDAAQHKIHSYGVLSIINAAGPDNDIELGAALNTVSIDDESAVSQSGGSSGHQRLGVMTSILSGLISDAVDGAVSDFADPGSGVLPGDDLVEDFHDTEEVEQASAQVDGSATQVVTEITLAAPEVYTALEQAELDAGVSPTDPDFVARVAARRAAEQAAHDEALALFTPPVLDLPDYMPLEYAPPESLLTDGGPPAYEPPSAALIVTWAGVHAGDYDVSYVEKRTQLNDERVATGAAWSNALSERGMLATQLAPLRDDIAAANDAGDAALAAQLQAEYDAKQARYDELIDQLPTLTQARDEAQQRFVDHLSAGPAGWEAERQAAFATATEIDAMRDAYRVKKLAEIDAYYDNRVADLTAEKNGLQDDLNELSVEYYEVLSYAQEAIRQLNDAYQAGDTDLGQQYYEEYLELTDLLWEISGVSTDVLERRDALQDNIDEVEALEASGEWASRKQVARDEMIADLAAQTEYDFSWYNAHHDAEVAHYHADSEVEIAADQAALDAYHAVYDPLKAAYDEAYREAKAGAQADYDAAAAAYFDSFGSGPLVGSPSEVVLTEADRAQYEALSAEIQKLEGQKAVAAWHRDNAQSAQDAEAAAQEIDEIDAALQDARAERLDLTSSASVRFATGSLAAGSSDLSAATDEFGTGLEELEGFDFETEVNAELADSSRSDDMNEAFAGTGFQPGDYALELSAEEVVNLREISVSEPELAQAEEMERGDIADRTPEINAESDAAVVDAQELQAEQARLEAERQQKLENPTDATASYVATDEDGNVSGSFDEASHMDAVMQGSGLERDGNSWSLAEREHEGMAKAETAATADAPQAPGIETIVDLLGLPSFHKLPEVMERVTENLIDGSTKDAIQTEYDNNPDDEKWNNVDSVGPVVLDLDQDGEIELIELSDSETWIRYDGEDGDSYKTAWISPDDGILAYDGNDDGLVTPDEFVFGSDGESDMEGLQRRFDSNDDKRLTAADDEWAKFGVWRDADGNGQVTGLEFVSLDDLGISDIDLDTSHSDGAQGGGPTKILRTNSYIRNGQAHDVGDVQLGRMRVPQEPAIGGVLGRYDEPDNHHDQRIIARSIGNRIVTGNGDDFVGGGGLWNSVNTGAGNDHIKMGAAYNYINAGDGDDRIEAFAGGNYLEAGSGNDFIAAFGVANVVNHGIGDDVAFQLGASNINFKGDGDFRNLNLGLLNVNLIEGDGDYFGINVGALGTVTKKVGDGNVAEQSLGTFFNWLSQEGDGHFDVLTVGAANMVYKNGDGDFHVTQVGLANYAQQDGNNEGDDGDREAEEINEARIRQYGVLNVAVRKGWGHTDYSGFGLFNAFAKVGDGDGHYKMGGLLNVLYKEGRGRDIAWIGGVGNAFWKKGGGDTLVYMLGALNIATLETEQDEAYFGGVILGAFNVVTLIGDSDARLVIGGLGSSVFTQVGNGNLDLVITSLLNVVTKVGAGNSNVAMVGGLNVFTQVGDGNLAVFAVGFGNIITHSGNVSGSATGNGDLVSIVVGQGNVLTKIGDGDSYIAGLAVALAKAPASGSTAALNVFTHVGDGNALGALVAINPWLTSGQLPTDYTGRNLSFVGNIVTKVGDGDLAYAMISGDMNSIRQALDVEAGSNSFPTAVNVVTQVGNGRTYVSAIGSLNMVTKVGHGHYDNGWDQDTSLSYDYLNGSDVDDNHFTDEIRAGTDAIAEGLSGLLASPRFDVAMAMAGNLNVMVEVNHASALDAYSDTDAVTGTIGTQTTDTLMVGLGKLGNAMVKVGDGDFIGVAAAFNDFRTLKDMFAAANPHDLFAAKGENSKTYYADVRRTDEGLRKRNDEGQLTSPDGHSDFAKDYINYLNTQRELGAEAAGRASWKSHLGSSGNLQVHVGHGNSYMTAVGQDNLNVKYGDGSANALLLGMGNVFLRFGNGRSSPLTIDFDKTVNAGTPEEHVRNVVIGQSWQLVMGNRNIVWNQAVDAWTDPNERYESNDVIAAIDPSFRPEARWFNPWPLGDAKDENRDTLKDSRGYIVQERNHPFKIGRSEFNLLEPIHSTKRGARHIAEGLKAPFTKKFWGEIKELGEKRLSKNKVAIAGFKHNMGDKLANLHGNIIVGGYGSDIILAIGTNNVVWADSPADTLEMDFGMFFSASSFAFAKLKKIPGLKNSTLALGLNPRFAVSAGTDIGDLTGLGTDGLGSMNVDFDPGQIGAEWANMVSGWPKTEWKMPFALNSGVGSIISGLDTLQFGGTNYYLSQLTGFDTDDAPWRDDEADAFDAVEDLNPWTAIGVFPGYDEWKVIVDFFGEKFAELSGGSGQNNGEDGAGDPGVGNDNWGDAADLTTYFQEAGFLSEHGDIVLAAGDENWVWGGAGGDILALFGAKNLGFGGDGRDIALLWGLDNRFQAGAGHDLMFLIGNENVAIMEDGNDIGIAIGEYNRAYGGDGNDAFLGVGNFNLLIGGNGDDLLIGMGAEMELYGDGGDDVLIGLGYANYYNTGAGNDYMFNLGLGAVVFYGSGRDIVQSAGEGAELDGEAGDDLFVLHESSIDNEISGSTGNDTFYLGGFNNLVDGRSSNSSDPEYNSFVLRKDVIEVDIGDLESSLDASGDSLFGESDRLFLGEGLLFEDLWFERERTDDGSNDANATYSDDLLIQIDRWDGTGETPEHEVGTVRVWNWFGSADAGKANKADLFIQPDAESNDPTEVLSHGDIDALVAAMADFQRGSAKDGFYSDLSASERATLDTIRINAVTRSDVHLDASHKEQPW